MAYFEDLEVGQAAEATHLIEASVIEAFGHAVGDLNPVHFDEAYAATTPFGGRIAHGMLAGGYISALIASAALLPEVKYFVRHMRMDAMEKVAKEIVTQPTAQATRAMLKKALFSQLTDLENHPDDVVR